ncbi:hypothetical protein JMJ35_006663 [Cladonia borealis]|uniref:Uncharacterized protein n=1 Tax=Cladonia borealis TaxID=184061 RepID=A0AA39QZ64_9LECA|nr:hypothetical protein JMJ35_006663 [Cladonia borealis]
MWGCYIALRTVATPQEQVVTCLWPGLHGSLGSICNFRAMTRAFSQSSHGPPKGTTSTTASRTSNTMHNSQYLMVRRSISDKPKKRTIYTVKRRGIIGASLDVIKERRSQRPEAHKTAQKEAIANGKEKKATSELKIKAEKAKGAAAGATIGARSIRRAAVRSNC